MEAEKIPRFPKVLSGLVVSALLLAYLTSTLHFLLSKQC